LAAHSVDLKVLYSAVKWVGTLEKRKVAEMAGEMVEKLVGWLVEQ